MAALTAIEVIARVVAVLAGAVGTVYGLSALISGQIYWLVDSSVYQVSGFVDLPLPLLIAHVVAVALAAVVIAVIALLVADLASRVRKGVEFVPAVSRTTWSIAIALAAGSWLTQIAANVASRVGLIYPDDVNPASADLDALPIDWSVGPWTFVPNLPLLGLAVVIGLLAYIIRSGERLQRDTEGLV